MAKRYGPTSTPKTSEYYAGMQVLPLVQTGRQDPEVPDHKRLLLDDDRRLRDRLGR